MVREFDGAAVTFTPLLSERRLVHVHVNLVVSVSHIDCKVTADIYIYIYIGLLFSF